MTRLRTFLYVFDSLIVLIMVLMFLGCSHPTTPVTVSGEPSFGINPAPTSGTSTNAPSNDTSNASPVLTPTQTPTPEPTEPPVVKISTATIGATGDILMHENLYKSGYDPETKAYNYDHFFTWFSKYVSEVDYAVANLEVTLAGDDNGYDYAGYPRFNCPDAIVDSLKKAGFDMLLTANNHSFDTGTTGFMRTQEVLMDRDMAYTGTRYKEEDKNYIVQDINGIKVGMICYTFNTEIVNEEQVKLNGRLLTPEATRLTNSFNNYQLEDFYRKIDHEYADMKDDGAEAFVIFIHWGKEYVTENNSRQEQIAQKLCDLGFDVIIGNHPHVAQPVELFTSTVFEDHKTLCLYSTGNTISNIRKSSTRPVHCEDGMLFNFTFAKYSDGTVLVESADVLPIWVNRFTDTEYDRYSYNILTLDRNINDWKTHLNLTDALLEKCEDSYERTMDIVGSGLEAANRYFSDNQKKTEILLGVKN